MTESVNIAGTYQTESGHQLRITPAAGGPSEWQVEFVDFRKQRKVSLEGRQVKDWKGRVGEAQPVSLDNGVVFVILFRGRGWWWMPVISHTCFEWKFDDCWTGSLSDHNPVRWSERTDITGVFAEITLSVSDQDSTEFSRPIFVRKCSRSGKVEASQKHITTYEGLQEILDHTEDLAFRWTFQTDMTGMSFLSWGKWMSKAELQLNLAVSNPDCKHPIQIEIFRGRPGHHKTEIETADSADSLREVLARRPRLLQRDLSNRRMTDLVVAARLAQEIYKPPERLKWACSAENGSAFFGIKSSSCMMPGGGQQHECIFVVFRGTVDAMTIFTDLKCTLSTDYPWSKFGLKVHQSMWADLKEALKDGSEAPGLVLKLFNTWKENQSARLIITGHSLGAGIAMLLQAYIWIQANTKECDPDFKKAFEEDTEFKGFLQTSRCFGFAGPMVLSKVGEVPAGLTKHLIDEVKNFMFRNDLVPRAYAALDVEAVMRDLGQQLTQRYRIVSGIASFVSWSAGLTNFKDSPSLKVVDKLKEGLDLGKFKTHANKFSHCCQVVVIGQRSVPWNKLSVSPEALSQHKMTTYRTSLEWPYESFAYTPVEWAKETTEVATPEMSESEIWSSVRESDDWTHVWRAFAKRPPETFVLPEGEANHFVHLAALQGGDDGKQKLIELLRIGANPLTLNRDGKSIVEVVTLKDDDPFKLWLTELVDIAEELRRAGCTGSDLAEKMANQWDENNKFINLGADALCELKRYNLRLQGVEDLQIYDGEDESESFSDALARIAKNIGQDELDRQRDEFQKSQKAHRFLDSAKWGDYAQMRDMLKADRSLACERIGGRWSALMQVAYNSLCWRAIDMKDVVVLLVCHDRLDAIRYALTEIEEVNREYTQVLRADEEEAPEAQEVSTEAAPLPQVGSPGYPATHGKGAGKRPGKRQRPSKDFSPFAEVPVAEASQVSSSPASAPSQTEASYALQVPANVSLLAKQKDGHPEVIMKNDGGRVRIPNGQCVTWLQDAGPDDYLVEWHGNKGTVKKANLEPPAAVVNTNPKKQFKEVPTLLEKIIALADKYTSENREFDIQSLVRESDPETFRLVSQSDPELFT
mmetsp:Transcript_139762/g.256466  ORF Transcript_139762/g.256466 Transcript_139762/m.256466 type:complete len:1095 (+) Transcript_139762:53-3337(+)